MCHTTKLYCIKKRYEKCLHGAWNMIKKKTHRKISEQKKIALKIISSVKKKNKARKTKMGKVEPTLD